MFTRRAFTGLVAAGVAGSAQAARADQDGPAGHRAPPVTGGSRRADVVALRAVAETTHPPGREAAADPKWRETWDALAAGADTLSDGAFFVGLWRGMSWFRDGHTTVLPFEFVGGAPPPFANGAFARYLPLKAKVFHDGIWVVEAKDEAAPLLGARIRSANGVIVWARPPWLVNMNRLAFWLLQTSCARSHSPPEYRSTQLPFVSRGSRADGSSACSGVSLASRAPAASSGAADSALVRRWPAGSTGSIPHCPRSSRTRCWHCAVSRPGRHPSVTSDFGAVTCAAARLDAHRNPSTGDRGDGPFLLDAAEAPDQQRDRPGRDEQAHDREPDELQVGRAEDGQRTGLDAQTVGQ